MSKKNLLLALLGVSFVFLVKCSKDLTYPEIKIITAVDVKGKPAVELTNNLSFPAIALDGFSITPLLTQGFAVPYLGNYPGLTTEEITYLQANGPWYPQKKTGNFWQAEYSNKGNEDITYIDWGDNIESVYPKIRSPFRLEVTLYKALLSPMIAYTMAVLEYPSSANELQGTNTTTYQSNYASVVSAKPKLVIQYLGQTRPTDLVWSVNQWTSSSSTLTNVAVSFAPELNVGGKYIFGASAGGWKPTSLGWYRVTFYIPSGSGVNLTSATVANFSNNFATPAEGTAATPVLDPVNNLTYVDLLAKASGGSTKKP